MSKKILIVEDDKSLQQLLGDMLESEGFEVVQAYNGEDGSNLAKSENPDIMLLDLRLPKKDGFEVLRELKANTATSSIPVIIFTNLETPENINRAIEAGATNYIVKSNYDLEDILKKIKQILE